MAQYIKQHRGERLNPLYKRPAKWHLLSLLATLSRYLFTADQIESTQLAFQRDFFFFPREKMWLYFFADEKQSCTNSLKVSSSFGIDFASVRMCFVEV